MSAYLWNTLTVIVALALAVLVWRGIREQQEREDQQAQEDRGIS